MSTKQTIISGTSSNPSGLSINYNSFMGNGNALWRTAEGYFYSVIPTAGRLRKFQVRVGVAPGAGNSWNFTVRVGNPPVDTALSVSIADTNLLSELDIDEAYVSAGELVTIKSEGISSPTACIAVYWACEFMPNIAGETILLGNTGLSSLTAGRFSPLIGTKSPDTVEFEAQTLFPTSGTLKKFFVQLDNAPGAGISRTLTIRKNEVDTALAVTISDTAVAGNNVSDTVQIAAGDKISIVASNSGTPASSEGKFGIVFVPDTQGEWFTCATTEDPSNYSATEYEHLTCSDSLLTATESEQHNLALATTAKAIYISLSAAPGVGKSYSFTLRRNADTSTLLTKTISETDTAGSYAADVAIADSDMLDTMIVPSGSPATAKSQIAYLFYNAPVTGGSVYEYAGNISLVVTPASSVNKIKIVAGGVQFSLLENSVCNLSRSVSGNISLMLVLNSASSYAHAFVYSGSISFSLGPSYTAVRIYERTGSCPVTLTPASIAQSVRIYNGSIQLSLIPNSVITRITLYAGSLGLSIMPNASVGLIKVFAGNIGISITPNGLSAKVKVHSGNIIVTLTPTHSAQRSYERTGAAVFGLMPNSAYQLNLLFTQVGNIALSLAPDSSVNRAITASGDLILSVNPAAACGKGWGYLGAIALSLAPGSSANLSKIFSGSIAISLTPDSEVRRVFLASSDLDLILEPEGTYFLDLHGYSYAGDVSFALVPAGAVIRVWSRDGNLLFTVAPGSEGGLALLELVKMNSGIEKVETLSSPLDFDESGMPSGIGKTVTLSSPIRGNT